MNQTPFWLPKSHLCTSAPPTQTPFWLPKPRLCTGAQPTCSVIVRVFENLAKTLLSSSWKDNFGFLAFSGMYNLKKILKSRTQDYSTKGKYVDHLSERGFLNFSEISFFQPDKWNFFFLSVTIPVTHKINPAKTVITCSVLGNRAVLGSLSYPCSHRNQQVGRRLRVTQDSSLFCWQGFKEIAADKDCAGGGS